MGPLNGDATENGDKADPIVHSFDICANNSIRHDLYMLDFPIRSINRSFETESSSPSDVRFKPGVKFLEWEVPRITSGQNQRRFMHLGGSDKQVLRSTSVSMQTNYVVGVFVDGTLQLSHVHGIWQLRPTFDHLDPISQDRKQHFAQKKSDEHGEDISNLLPEEKDFVVDEVEDILPATVIKDETDILEHFSEPNTTLAHADEVDDAFPSRLIHAGVHKRESDRAARQRLRAQWYKQVQDEPWVSLKYFPSGSLQSSQIRRDSLLCKDNAQKSSYASCTQLAYLDMLCKTIKSDDI